MVFELTDSNGKRFYSTSDDVVLVADKLVKKRTGATPKALDPVADLDIFDKVVKLTPLESSEIAAHAR